MEQDNSKIRKSKLLEKVIELLSQTSIPQIEIAEKTGINYHTLQKLRYGEGKNHSVDRVEALYVFLTGKELKL